MTANSLTSHERSLINAVSTDDLMASTIAIAGWVRHSGTSEEAEAFDWIESTLKQHGLETTRHQHPGLVS